MGSPELRCGSVTYGAHSDNPVTTGEWLQRRNDSAAAPDWDLLTRAVADRYRLRVDEANPRGKPRYIAVARSLDVRPYAVVTSDPAELLTALGCAPSEPPVTARKTRP